MEKRDILCCSVEKRVDKFYLVKVRRWIEFEMWYTITKGTGNLHPLLTRSMYRRIMPDNAITISLTLEKLNNALIFFCSDLWKKYIWSSPFHSKHLFQYCSRLVDYSVPKLQRILESYSMLIKIQIPGSSLQNIQVITLGKNLRIYISLYL